jgi:hypothetical protein
MGPACRSIFSVARTGGAALCLAVYIGSAGVAYGQDVVITTSGDRLVGEIKRVEKDVLTLETAYSDADFKIEWEDVAALESKRQFLVETFDGRRLSGSLNLDPDKKPVVQIAGTSVPLAEVSVVQPFERTFWSRWDTALDFGYSMTRTNSATQLSLGTNTSYRDERYVDVIFANIFNSSQDNAPDTKRWDLGNDFRRLLGNRWYANTTQDFLNSENKGWICGRRSVSAAGVTCCGRRRSTWRSGRGWRGPMRTTRTRCCPPRTRGRPISVRSS